MDFDDINARDVLANSIRSNTVDTNIVNTFDLVVGNPPYKQGFGDFFIRNNTIRDSPYYREKTIPICLTQTSKDTLWNWRDQSIQKEEIWQPVRNASGSDSKDCSLLFVDFHNVDDVYPQSVGLAIVDSPIDKATESAFRFDLEGTWQVSLNLNIRYELCSSTSIVAKFGIGLNGRDPGLNILATESNFNPGHTRGSHSALYGQLLLRNVKVGDVCDLWVALGLSTDQVLIMPHGFIKFLYMGA